MIDSHCHLADDAFVDDVGAVVTRAIATGLTGALCILDLTTESELARVPALTEAWPAVRFAVGIHPHKAATFADRVSDVQGAVRETMARLGAVVAIGEIGLDHHYDFAPRQLQRDVFAEQVALAREVGRPVVIHTREADTDTLDVLRSAGRGEVRGVFHCFTGDVTLARRALDLGFHLSFSGIVTFRNATGIREAAASSRPTGSSWRPTAPISRPFPTEENETNRRGSRTWPRRWP